ncbi:unnamed protein product [Symbiodinium sp. CCMP2456]|nr:unnamed protein product [Symbiodinium sp. CCMP2456]
MHARNLRQTPLAIAWLACLLLWEFTSAESDSCRSSDDTSLIQLAPSNLRARVSPCLNAYQQSVQSVLSDYGDHVLQRSWGGSSAPARTGQAPVLGVGFDGATSMALATFCRQRGLSVLHARPGQQSHWISSYPALYGKYKSAGRCRKELDKFDFSLAAGEGYNVLFDEAVSHHFLDFFFISPDSKVLLAVHPSTERQNQTSTIQFRSEHTFPAMSTCNRDVADVSQAQAIDLMRAHQDLVRCVVPSEQLLEVRLENNNLTAISAFLGLGLRQFEAPWPQFRYGFTPRFSGGGDRKAVGKTLSVCITGQMGRLELESKIAHVIKPASRQGMQVIVMVVLDPRDSTHFVHRGGLDVVIGPYKSFDDFRGLIPGPASVIYDPFIPEDFPIIHGYLEELRKEPGNPRMRAFSHMRQWEALSRCAELQKDHQPDMTLRLREDTYLLQSMHPDAEKEGVYVPQCRPCGGVNDKAAFAVGADVAYRYLTTPLKLMRTDFDFIRKHHKAHSKGAMGPEAVLMESLFKAKIKSFPLPPESLPMAPARHAKYEDQFYYCFYRSVQECIPEATLRQLKAKSPRINGVANESVACTPVSA